MLSASEQKHIFQSKLETHFPIYSMPRNRNTFSNLSRKQHFPIYSMPRNRNTFSNLSRKHIFQSIQCLVTETHFLIRIQRHAYSIFTLISWQVIVLGPMVFVWYVTGVPSGPQDFECHDFSFIPRRPTRFLYVRLCHKYDYDRLFLWQTFPNIAVLTL